MLETMQLATVDPIPKQAEFGVARGAAFKPLPAAREKRQTVQAIVERSRDACRSQRWFKAIRELDKLSLEEINAYGLAPTMEYAREGIDRADAYLKLLLWTLFAGGVVLSSGWLATALSEVWRLSSASVQSDLI